MALEGMEGMEGMEVEMLGKLGIFKLRMCLRVVFRDRELYSENAPNRY